MNYPLISEYIETIKSAEDNFEELTSLRPVSNDTGLPVMTNGVEKAVHISIDRLTEKMTQTINDVFSAARNEIYLLNNQNDLTIYSLNINDSFFS